MDCPITSEAAAASSSASAGSVTSRTLPNISRSPICVRSGSRPAVPIAMPTVPLRQARPALSLIMTWTDTPAFSESRSRKARAEASGSRGNSRTCWSSGLLGILDLSIPALACTYPLRCSTIMTPGRTRTTSRLSCRISSTWRGSFTALSASATASGPASTSARRT